MMRFAASGLINRLFRTIALENRARLDAGDTNWQGIAFHLDAETYGGG